MNLISFSLLFVVGVDSFDDPKNGTPVPLEWNTCLGGFVCCENFLQLVLKCERILHQGSMYLRFGLSIPKKKDWQDLVKTKKTSKDAAVVPS